MINPKRLKKSGKHAPLRGIRLPRTRKFEAVIETKSGLKVRSKYEQRCADYLFANEITFQYEPLMLLGGRQFRPDFYLPQFNLFIEICGYNHMPFYRDRTKHKIDQYSRHGLKAIFIYYNGKGSPEALIKDELAKLGINLKTEQT